MSNVTTLAAHRLSKQCDAQTVSPADALRAALELVESGAFDADIVYVALANTKDGRLDVAYRAAGGDRLKMCGLLAHHSELLCSESWGR
jgi:hypothetical protein